MAKDTFIYGMSSIIGRFLNYLLVPLYTAKMAASTGAYGVITNVYAYTALLLVLLTFGMETTYFRFSTNEKDDPQRVYSTTLLMVGGVCLVFVALVMIFLQPISAWMQYPDHPEYVGTMFVCVAIDAFQCVPFAHLRRNHRPIKFAALKLLFIFLNILLNLAYFMLVPWLYAQDWGRPLVSSFYDGQLDLAWAFYINLFCTASVTFFFYKELTGFPWVFDKALAKRMWHYSWPILALGVAGILNQTADKIIFPFVSTHVGKEINVQLGIYGAAVKIAMIMTLITQAFRYAYEPFVFSKSHDRDSKETYAAAMKYFIIFTLLAFLVVVAYLPLFKHLIGPDYWGGLRVTPIVMVAGILLGIYFNLLCGLCRLNCGQRSLYSALRLYGLRLGRCGRLRRSYDFELFCRAEILPDQVSFEEHSRLRLAHSFFLHADAARTGRLEFLAHDGNQYGVYHPLHCSRSLPRFSRQAFTNHRQIL